MKTIDNQIYASQPFIDISLADLTEAEMFWIKKAQEEYHEEIAYLQEPKKKARPTLVMQLNLQIKEGILVCSGRFAEAEWPESTKNPVLLPSRHPLTNLIIIDCHERCLHEGVSMTIGAVRERWWIPKARQRVKSILNTCVKCKKVIGKPYARPPFAQLLIFVYKTVDLLR